jgi:Coenzyme PQQ synthesis protein D (PqqD)
MRYQLSRSLRVATLNDQAFLMDVAEGKFFACNAVAASIIGALQLGNTVQEIVDLLSQRFTDQTPTQIEKDTLQFLNHLAVKGFCYVDR